MTLATSHPNDIIKFTFSPSNAHLKIFKVYFATFYKYFMTLKFQNGNLLATTSVSSGKLYRPVVYFYGSDETDEVKIVESNTVPWGKGELRVRFNDFDISCAPLANAQGLCDIVQSLIS